MKSLLAAVSLLALLGTTAPAGAVRADRGGMPTPGPGWSLAAVEQGRPTAEGIRAKRLRLELVAPDGGRSEVLDVRQRGYRLVDWSADAATALLVTDYPRPRALRVDVASGTASRVPLPRDISQVLLAPDGGGLLAVTYERGRTGRAPLVRLDRDGTRTRLSPDVDGPLLPTPDGSGLVTHGSDWRQREVRLLSTADGSVRTEIPTPRRCDPVRWWDDHRVLVSCLDHGATTLGLVDLRAATYTRLTERRHPQRMDLGHLDARRAGGRLYVQVAGPCGYVYLGRRHRDGRITRVRVPHAVGNVLLVGARDGRLLLQHAIGCDGATPRSALTLFDPATRTERRLVVLPRDEAFAAVLPYGEPRPTGY